MKRVEELLAKEEWNKENSIWFEVYPEDEKEFLKYAKENGCKWLNGEEIDLEKVHGGYHMSISKKLTLAFVPYFAWGYYKEKRDKALKFKS